MQNVMVKRQLHSDVNLLQLTESYAQTDNHFTATAH